MQMAAEEDCDHIMRLKILLLPAYEDIELDTPEYFEAFLKFWEEQSPNRLAAWKAGIHKAFYGMPGTTDLYMWLTSKVLID